MKLIEEITALALRGGDITFCNDMMCPRFKQCRRGYGERPYRYSAFMESPRTDEGCEMYWGTNQDIIMEVLNEATDSIGFRQSKRGGTIQK